jgi:glycosyltransferase involved in cell wall biosynthesis
MTMLTPLPETPLVSVILTAYNYAQYLPASIDSALGQDYPAERLEIVVVDDGSTDATPEVLATYADRVRAIRRPNGGLNAATTTGMEAATGQLYTFLDADDLWAPDRIRLLVDALRANPEAGLAYGDMEIMDADGVTTEPSFRAAAGLTASSGRVFGRLLANNFISAGALMVRAELADSFCPIPPYAAHQDWWIASQVARVAEVVAIPESVNRYRKHAENMNLGVVEGERLLRLWEVEIPFRRHLLQTADPALSTPVELAAAIDNLDTIIARVMRLRGAGAAEVLGLDAGDRARAIEAMREASDALDDERLGFALARLIAAAAHDPLWLEPRHLLTELAPVVRTAYEQAVAA